MMVALLRLWFVFVVCVATVPAFAAQSARVDTGHGVASIVSSHDRVAPGQTIQVAVLTELDRDPDWHTYWINPGDSGEPVTIDWKGAEVSELFWPTPKPIPTGPLINYGFEGSPLFAVELTVPDDASGRFVVEADLYYLVCWDVCVPEEASLSLSLSVGEPIADPGWGPKIADAIAVSPRNRGRGASMVRVGNELRLDVAGSLPGVEPYVFPVPGSIIDPSAEQGVLGATDGNRFVLAPGFAWDNGDVPDGFEALISYKTEDGLRGEYVSVATDREIAIGDVAVPAGAPANSAEGTGVFFAAAVVGAFFGGLLLNLMPCVFPVISLKALALARTAHAGAGEARVEGLIYTAGVFATLLGLAGLVIALKAGGNAVGWGFQLQDPRVVGVLALVTFAIGLNLMGVFEIGGRLQNAGQGLVASGGRAGAFWTGVLAVVVATPCTAPFMAGALGFAFTQPAHVTLIVFAALALGFALPFLLLGFAPGLLRRLPRPGPWMETFKQVLAFPLFATSAWLVWVLAAQAGADGVGVVLVAGLLVAFAAWLARRLSGARRIVAGILAVLGFALPAVLSAAPVASASPDVLAWSPEAVEQTRADGRAVFVDFTADWCITCKVNERTVLSRDDVSKLFADTDTAFMVADWTNKNDEIARELEVFGRAGVPLYLVYPPGHDAVSPEVLPQILTRNVVREALLRANSR